VAVSWGSGVALGGRGVEVGVGVKVGAGVSVTDLSGAPTAISGVGFPAWPAVLVGLGVCFRSSVSCAGVGSGDVEGVWVTVPVRPAASLIGLADIVASSPAANATVVSQDVTFTTPSITTTWVAPSASVATVNSVPRTAATAVGVWTQKRDAKSLRRFTRLCVCPSHW
jgi:hypothetical protein